MVNGYNDELIVGGYGKAVQEPSFSNWFKYISKGMIMPYTTEWQENGIWWTYCGVVTAKEVLECNLEIYGDDRFDSLTYELMDLSQAERLELTEAQVKKIAYLDKAAARSNPNMRVALVSKMDLIKELFEMYAKYSEESPWEIENFETVEEARKWLGI